MEKKDELFEILQSLQSNPAIAGKMAVIGFGDELNTQENELAALRAENAKLRKALTDCLEYLEEGQDEINARGWEALKSTTPDPLYLAAPEMLEVMEIALYVELAKDAANKHAAAIHNNTDGVGISFDYIAAPPMPQWVYDFQKIIAKAKGETA